MTDGGQQPSWRERARAKYGAEARAYLESLGPDDPDMPAPDTYEGPVPEWRAGRSVGRTIYRMVGEEASKADVLIGMMDTPELAAQVASAVNEKRSRLKHRGGNAEDCPICCWRKGFWPFICTSGEGDGD